MRFIREAIIKWARGRSPDFIIGGHERPYLRRHWLIPRNRFFNIYVHEFLRSDDDRAHHDHPWLFNASWLIAGRYIEHTIAAGGVAVATRRKAGDWKFRWGPAPHRVELPIDEAPVHPSHWICGHPNCAACGVPQGDCIPCWTVFITGPIVREWGFHCPERGWVPWKLFTAKDDPGAVGRGCEQ